MASSKLNSESRFTVNQAIAGIAAGREEGSMEGGSEGGTEGTGAVAAAAYARNARHASSSPHTAVEIRAACPRYWRQPSASSRESRPGAVTKTTKSVLSLPASMLVGECKVEAAEAIVGSASAKASLRDAILARQARMLLNTSAPG